ncbi:Zn-dependent hydrolase [Pseudohalocynthiibacter aestuariivivens]|nr:Zn-dependent hydrolase [Pseudohalocynthiibacter aestuariivivens]QIE44469.1 Zn-dependent hydrolase [Pseudohalocynthiibacter aestuariivivens]
MLQNTDAAQIEINGDRLFDTLNQSAQIGPGRAGGLHRLALSDADKEMRDLFVRWCEDLGCVVRIDQAGNMFARMEGREDLPPVLIGSHLDTQMAGGRFDGILGVLTGLEILRVLKEAGITPKRAIEVVNWANEEGARFAPPMTSSAVFAGVKTLDWLYALKDDDGLTFGDELARIGYKGKTPAAAFPIDSYFEFHIEQGPELHIKNLPLGVVVGGYKSHGMNVIFRGETAHSGPTAMENRRNALVGAAKFISAVNDIGWAHAPIGKSTASRISLWPNKNGILPDYAETTVDMRHRDKNVTDQMVVQAREALTEAARVAQVDYEIEAEWTFGDEVFDPELIELICDTARGQGIEPLKMHSQAGHDAYNLCHVAPTALIFCPCIDGITHNEDENIAREPTVQAATVVLQAVLARANR